MNKAQVIHKLKGEINKTKNELEKISENVKDLEKSK